MTRFGVLKDSLNLLIITFIAKSTVFIVNVFSAKYLQQSEYGALALLRATAAMIEGVFTGVASSFLISNISKSEINKKINFLPILFLLFFYVFVAFSFIVYVYSFGEDATYIFLLSAVLMCSSLFNAIFIGKGWFKEQIQLTAISCIVSLPCSLFLIIFLGYQGAKWAFLFIFFLESIFKFFLLLKKRSLFTFVRESQFLYILRSFKYVVIVVPQLFLFWFIKVEVSNKDITNLATFDFFYQFVTIIMLVTGTVSSASIKSFNGKDKFLQLKISLLVNFVICLIVFLFFLFNSKFIVTKVNPLYILDDDLLFLLLLIVFPFSIVSVISKFFIAMGFDKYNFYSSSFAVLSIVAYIFNKDLYTLNTLIYSYLGFYGIYMFLLTFFCVKCRFSVGSGGCFR